MNLFALCCCVATIWGEANMIRIDHRARMSADAINRTLRTVDKLNSGWTPFQQVPEDIIMPVVYASIAQTPIVTVDGQVAYGYPYYTTGESSIAGQWAKGEAIQSTYPDPVDYRAEGYGWVNRAGITGSDLLLLRTPDPRPESAHPTFAGKGVAGEARYWHYPFFPETVEFTTTAAGSIVSQADSSVFGIEEGAYIFVDGAPLVGMPTFLAMCPDGTVINEAKMEFTVSDLIVMADVRTDDGQDPPTITHSWPDYPNPTNTGPVGIAVVVGIADGQSTRWVIAGSAVGGTAESGKFFVADVTHVARALLAWRSQGLVRGVAFIPWISMNWINSRTGDFRGALSNLRGTTKIAQETSEGRVYFPTVTNNVLSWGGCNHGGRMWLNWTYPASVRNEAIQAAQWPILADD